MWPLPQSSKALPSRRSTLRIHPHLSRRAIGLGKSTDPLDETRAENGIVPRNRRTERLENIRNREESRSDSQDSEEAVSITAPSESENAEGFQVDLLSYSSNSERSPIELVGAIESQPTSVTAVAPDSFSATTQGITATPSLRGVPESNTPVVTGSSEATIGTVNSSAAVNGGQANARFSTGASDRHRPIVRR